ncbi:MAG: polysaccharide biosynthesis tyrosine autokinase, partial [Bacteroidia bacterium]
MNQNQNTHTEDTIDLKELFFSLIAQWKLIALCVFLSLVCALLYLRVTPNTYSVDALIQVEDSKGASSALLGDLSSMIEQKSPAQAEIEILRSRLVLGEVIGQLHLDVQLSSQEDNFKNRFLGANHYDTVYSNDAVIFKDNLKSLHIKQFDLPEAYLDQPLHLKINQNNYQLLDANTAEVLLQAQLNKKVKIHNRMGLWTVEINSKDIQSGLYNIRKQSLPNAIKSLSANYAVAERGKLTGVLGLNYQGADKIHITQVLNAILKAYSVQNIERRTAESAQTLKFLDEQLPELKKQLDNAEREFNKFRQQYNTVDVSKESELYLSQSITLETKKIELKQQQADLVVKYTDDHPAMREINAQIAALDSQIKSLNNTLKRLPDLQRQYLQLYREVEVKTQLYTGLLNSYQQLRIAKAGEIGNVRIIDTAIKPAEPIKPKKLQILILSLFLGGFLGTLIALLRNMLRTGIKDSTQIENEFDLPVYATVPRSSLQENRMHILRKKKTIPILAVKHHDDIAIESLRSIRTAIHFALASAKNNIIMIAGPSPEVGKSFISSNLATIFAQNNQRILLIDADLRRGYLHKYFNIEVKPGLSELLSQQVSLEQALHKTEIANLDVISRGKSPTNPSEMLSSHQFKTLLEQLSQQYDYIIIDTPPVLAVTDGIIISQYVGINLLIARYAKAQHKELELSLSRFEQAGVKVNGFILNDVQRGNGGYGYGYGYGYIPKNPKIFVCRVIIFKLIKQGLL